MLLQSMVIAVAICGLPDVKWTQVKVPRVLISCKSKDPNRQLRLNMRNTGIYLNRSNKVVISADGAQVVVVTELGAASANPRTGRLTWVSQHQLASVRDAVFSPKGDIIVSSGDGIVYISRTDGSIRRRIPFHTLWKFAVLPSGELVGPVKSEISEAWENRILSPDDGHMVADCGSGKTEDHDIGLIAPVFVVRSKAGNHIAGGGTMSTLWVCDPYVQQTRKLTRYSGDAPFTAACFDPSGRYLVAGFGECEICVFDLFRSGRRRMSRIRGTQAYAGKFEMGTTQKRRIGSVRCRGIGFANSRWLWFTNGAKLYFCGWPDLQVKVERQLPHMVGVGTISWSHSRTGKIIGGFCRYSTCGLIIGTIQIAPDEK